MPAQAGWALNALSTPQTRATAQADYAAETRSRQTLAPNGNSLSAQTYNGWFLGGGLEYQIPWFRGLSSRTEYRVAEYGRQTITNIATVTGAPLVTAEALRPYVQTIRTQLVYKFNWAR
jgi:hypothetical protein